MVSCIFGCAPLVTYDSWYLVVSCTCAGYAESWSRGSRREVQKRYDRLVRFQKVVKSTLESAEKAEVSK